MCQKQLQQAALELQNVTNDADVFAKTLNNN